MLVLSRKNDQSVVIGGSNHSEHMLKITVLEIGHGSVRLGFEANQDVPVYREEVWERISRPRDPPAGGPDRARSGGAHGMATVFSGEGQGTGPNSVRDSV